MVRGIPAAIKRIHLTSHHIASQSIMDSFNSFNKSGSLKVPGGSLSWFASLRGVDSSQKEKPLLVFIHAGVADHTLWDEQREYLHARGWSTLSFDLFGFGTSQPDAAYLEADPRPAISYIEHIASLVHEFTDQEAESHRVVIIGLSMGGMMAVDFAIAYPELCAGAVAIAAWVSGFEGSGHADETALEERMKRALKDSKAEELANLYVRYWGDGPLQAQGRLSGPPRERLQKWCSAIAERECKKEGGAAFPVKELEPPAIDRLGEIQVPIAVGVGMLDESPTVAAMHHLAKAVKGASVKEFNAAHMVNLEFPTDVNVWLNDFLEHQVLLTV